jgi:hypothetical protein
MSIPQRIVLKGFKRGRKMTLKEYQLRVTESREEVQMRVGAGMTREQRKRFESNARLEMPFVPRHTFVLPFEVQMFKLKEKYVQLFKDELAGVPRRVATALPTAVAVVPMTARERQLAIIVKRCHEEIYIDALRVQAESNPDVHETQEAHAEAVMAFISKEGVTPSSREEAMLVLCLHGQM